MFDIFITWWLQFILLLDGSLRLATPLIFCGMAGILSERAGIIDISLEGKMLIAAFAAAAAAAITGSPVLGLVAGIFAACLFALIHAFATITVKGNQVVSGLAINMLASGLSITLAIALFAQGGQTPFLDASQRFSAITLPLAETIAGLPIIGSTLGVIYKELLSGHNILVWLSLVAVVATGMLLTATRFGLCLRACGEMPEAVDTAGKNVAWIRYQAVLITGILCGCAGAYLSIAHGGGFVREMTAGKGYIALAAVIFGHWRPIPVLLACLMFGLFESLASRLGTISSDVILVLPYILTVVLLAGVIRPPKPPRALGIPYNKIH
ncbi:MAG: ABC transporter permease [Proteobacteria bacterium]|nr:ABC transporter permease [Pseudomonadota bacterium]